MANTPAQLPAHPERDDDPEDQAVSGSWGSDQADSSGMKSKTLVSKKLRDSARDRDCQVRIPGVCNHDPRTVVLAHLNGGGMGMKQDDLFGAFCCSACHDEVDRRTKYYEIEDVQRWFYEGMVRTQKIWLDEGFINVK